MFKIKNNDAFKKSLEQISLFVDECNVHFNDEGIKITAFDNAQIIYLEYFLSAQGIEGELPSTVFGINVVEFNKILSKINSDEELFLDIKDKSLDVIINGKYSRTFSFSQKIVDDKILDLNSKDYPVIIKENPEILKDIFSCSKVVSESIIFSCESDSLNILADGLYGKYNTKLNIKNKEIFKAKFSSSHLVNMLKNCPLDNSLEIRLSSKYPFYLTYNICDNNLKFFLAHMFL